MSEQDVINIKVIEHPPCDNDVFAETFHSMLDPRFASTSERVEYGSDEKGERRSYRDMNAQ